MYSKEQAVALKQAFWTAFGQYMALHLSADGEKISWINYKTGIKNLYFKLDAGQYEGAIMIDIASRDPRVQELIFEQFKALKNVLTASLAEEWDWELHTENEYGKTVSRIAKRLPGKSIYKQEDWPDLISFLKVRLLALDEFWSTAQYSFEEFK